MTRKKQESATGPDTNNSESVPQMDGKKEVEASPRGLSTDTGGIRRRWRYPKFGTPDGTLKAEIIDLKKHWRGELSTSDLFKRMSAYAMHRQTIESVVLSRRIGKLEEEKGVRR